MKDLVDTTEMYLRTIFELEEEGIVPLRARIAERLDQSGPTVSQTVARMERDGLLHVRPDRSLELTAEGRKLATAVMRKHRLAERLLTDVLGLDIHRVHDEACRWEHVMSEEVERCMVSVLDDPSRSPFGNPIPGLDQLGVKEPAAEVATRITDLPRDTEIPAKITQINEILQADGGQFRELEDAGIGVNQDVTVLVTRDAVKVTTASDETVELPEELAHAIRVVPKN